jgi:signal transduction histidine kinase
VTVIAAVTVAAGLGTASVLLVSSLRGGLIAGLDDAASSRAADAVSALAHGDTALAVRAAGGDSTLVQVLGPDGQVMANSPGLNGSAPLVQVPLLPGSRFPTTVSIGERDFRAHTTPTLSATGAARTVVVVAPLADVEEAMVQLGGRLLLGAPVLLALICAAVWVLVGYTLHTVDRLRGQVAELSAAGLGRRVDVPVAHDEVRELAVTMNGLLDRLQGSAQAQHRFVADAAHELRSPLAALRARLEVSERASDPARWAAGGTGHARGHPAARSSGR